MMENGKLKVLSNAALKNVLGGETYNLMRTQKTQMVALLFIRLQLLVGEWPMLG